MTKHPVLDLPMPENDSGAITIRGYLKELLAVLVTDAECFDAKRPFGNSGWDLDLMDVLYDAGLADKDDYGEANRILVEAIKDM